MGPRGPWQAAKAYIVLRARRISGRGEGFVEGRFRSYWEQNGGLPVFGFPITSSRPEVNRDTGQSYITQHFERNRFELHPENQAPYDVLLGRLGDDRLRQTGIDWQALPREPGARDGCLWFAQTGHNVCDQGAGLGFKSYWQTRGLVDPRLDTFGRSLALFGLPLTEARLETNSSGDTVVTQWFERARFEWHPGNPDAYKVLLGLLGNETNNPGGNTNGPIRYTALGDSLATGILAAKGYVPTYRDYLAADSGREVELTNLGRNGWSSTDLLNALRTNATMRDAVAQARVVTWNIGGNDLADARATYKARRCGGADNQECLRATIATFKANWPAIIAEIRSLRSAGDTTLRTMDIYNPYVNQDRGADTWADDGGRDDFAVFKPYVDDVNSYIRSTAAANNIPAGEVYRAYNGPGGDEDPRGKGYITFDNMHPSDAGHKVIADLLRGLGYGLTQRR